MKDARAGRRRSGRTQPVRPTSTPPSEAEATPAPASEPATRPASEPVARPASEPTPAAAAPPVAAQATTAAPSAPAAERPPRSPRASRPGGRPRDPDREAAIVAAALDLVAEEGLPGLTMDALAVRAGASKATLYRRWPDRLHLALHLLARAGSARPDPPETGEVRGDLAALLRTLDEELHGPLGALVLGLAAEARRSPLLAQELRRHRDAEHQRVRTVLALGVERGQVHARTDLDLLAATVAASGLERAVTAAPPLTGRAAEDLADRLLATSTAGPGRADR